MSRRTKLEDLLEKNPNDPFLHFGLAMELVKEGNREEALARFDRVLELDPHYTAAHFHKGNTLIGMGRLEEARQVLTTGVVEARRSGDGHALSEMQELLNSVG